MTSRATIPNHRALAGIVLAAGASSRMGRLKPLLPLAGIPALERAIAVFHDGGIDEVLVVLGHRAEDVRALAEPCGARCILNPNFREGMYSSVVAGARALPPFARAAFLLPADVPLVRATTIRRLAAAFLAQPSDILYPTFDKRRGHPPLIARAILDQAASDETGPLRTLLAAHEHGAMDVPVADEAIHLDMDTPADFERLQALAVRRAIPTAGECEAMLEQHCVAQARISHSRKVAAVAGSIAEVLAATGLAIHPELTRAGGLLHDIAKGQPKHAEAGAAILRSYEMPGVAAIVAAHTEMNFTGTLDERAIVYLADKLVAGVQVVTIEERFQPSLFRFRDDPAARKAAERRKAVAEQIAAAIEARAGAPLAAILSEGARASAKEGNR